jgi:hypothetical protein
MAISTDSSPPTRAITSRSRAPRDTVATSLIRTLAALGLAKDIQLLPRSADRFRIGRDRMADDVAGLEMLDAEPEPSAAATAA